MKKIITILTLLCSFGLKAGAQQFLSREAYRDKVEAYSQVLKQQRLKTMQEQASIHRAQLNKVLLEQKRGGDDVSG